MALCSCTLTLSTSSSSSCPSWARATEDVTMATVTIWDVLMIRILSVSSVTSGFFLFQRAETLKGCCHGNLHHMGHLDLWNLKDCYWFAISQSKERMLLSDFTAGVFLTEGFAYNLFWVVWWFLGLFLCLHLHIMGCFH